MATTKSKNVQTNEPGWSSPPTWQGLADLQGIKDQGGDYATPIRNQYARAEQKLSQSYNNPLGAYTTADVRDKAMREQTQNMSQMMGMDLANAAQQNADARWNRYATIAGMSAPRFYNAKTTESSRFTPGDFTRFFLGFGG